MFLALFGSVLFLLLCGRTTSTHTHHVHVYIEKCFSHLNNILLIHIRLLYIYFMGAKKHYCESTIIMINQIKMCSINYQLIISSGVCLFLCHCICCCVVLRSFMCIQNAALLSSFTHSIACAMNVYVWINHLSEIERRNADEKQRIGNIRKEHHFHFLAPVKIASLDWKSVTMESQQRKKSK